MEVENKIRELLENVTPEQATEIRKQLKGKSSYSKKGIYREKENKVRYFNPDEWEQFFYSVPEQLRKYYLFLFITGMRYKEAKNVQKKHIEWNNRSIVIFKPKGGVQRNVSFSSWGRKKIKPYFDEIKNEDTLNFPTIQHLIQTMKKICIKNKIPYAKDFSVHNIRKTHENCLIALDLPQNKLTAHMGHTPKTAQEHYNSSVFIKDKSQLDKIRIWFGDIFGVNYS